jgi:hypothetical protein
MAENLVDDGADHCCCLFTFPFARKVLLKGQVLDKSMKSQIAMVRVVVVLYATPTQYIFG